MPPGVRQRNRVVRAEETRLIASLSDDCSWRHGGVGASFDLGANFVWAPILFGRQIWIGRQFRIWRQFRVLSWPKFWFGANDGGAGAQFVA